jgi:hypothetical protein
MKVSNLSILKENIFPFRFQLDEILVVIAILCCLLVVFNYIFTTSRAGGH